MLFLTARPAFSDWEYELPNNYVIFKVNSQCIVLSKYQEHSYDRVIDAFILEFCYNDVYIGLKRLPWDFTEHSQLLDLENYESGTIKYYIVNSENDTIYGPYTEEEFNNQCGTLEITDLCE